MKYLWLTRHDGQYSTRLLDANEANDARAKGCTVVEVRDDVYTAWQAHLAQSAVWDSLWTALDNEAYERR